MLRTTVAEVITYSNPEPVASAPAGCSDACAGADGDCRSCPISRMVGWSDEAASLGAKVAVLKGVGNHARMPYFAVLTQGFPRLITIAEKELGETCARDAALPDGIYLTANFHGDNCVVPDLAVIEEQIVGVLQGARPMAAA